MPLTKGSSEATIGRNISEMEASGHPHDQAVAAALHTADQYSRPHRFFGGSNFAPYGSVPQGGAPAPQWGGQVGFGQGVPQFGGLQSFLQSPQFQQLLMRYRSQQQPTGTFTQPNAAMPTAAPAAPTGAPALQTAPQPQITGNQAPDGMKTALGMPAGQVASTPLQTNGAATATQAPMMLKQPSFLAGPQVASAAPAGALGNAGGGTSASPYNGALHLAEGGIARARMPEMPHMAAPHMPHQHIPEPHLHKQPMFAEGGVAEDEHHDMGRHIAHALMLAGKYKANKPQKAKGGETMAQSASGADRDIPDMPMPGAGADDVDTSNVLGNMPQAARTLKFMDLAGGKRPEDVTWGGQMADFAKHDLLPTAAMTAVPFLRMLPKSVTLPAIAGLAGSIIPGAANQAEAQARHQNQNSKAPPVATKETLPALPGTEISGNLPPDVAADPQIKVLLQQIQDAKAIRDRPLDPNMSGKTRQGAIDSLPALQQQLSERVGALTRSSRPFSQAHPDLNEWWNAIQWGGPALAAYLTKNTSDLATRAFNSGANKAVNAAEEMLFPRQSWWSKMRGEAAPKPDMQRAAYEIMKADEYAKAHPWMTSPGMQKALDWTGKLAPPAAGAGFGVEASLYRPQYDIANTPEDAPAHKEAKEKVKTIWPYIMGGGIGALTGFTGAHILPTIGPGRDPRAATNALRRFTGLGGGEPPQEPGPTGPSSGGPGSPGLPGGGARTPLLDQSVSEAELLPKPQGPEPGGGGGSNLPAVTPKSDTSLSSLNPNDAMRRLTPPPARPPRPAAIDEPEPKPPEPEPPEPTKFKLGKVQLPKGHPSGFGGRWVPHEIINDPVKEAEYLKKFTPSKTKSGPDTAKGSGSSKGNDKGTANNKPAPEPDDEEPAGYINGQPVPRKPPKPQVEDEHAYGGSVFQRAMGGAISLARKYASGGKVVVGPVVGATGGRADKLPVKVPSNSFVIPADVVSGLGEGNTEAGMKVLAKRFGAAGGRGAPGVDIMISHGEFVVSPEAVLREGHGSMAIGHKKLEQFVIDERNKHINTLASLPGPARD